MFYLFLLSSKPPHEENFPISSIAYVLFKLFYFFHDFYIPQVLTIHNVEKLYRTALLYKSLLLVLAV
jgi:hypothetical protein